MRTRRGTGLKKVGWALNTGRRGCSECGAGWWGVGFRIPEAGKRPGEPSENKENLRGPGSSDDEHLYGPRAPAGGSALVKHCLRPPGLRGARGDHASLGPRLGSGSRETEVLAGGPEMQPSRGGRVGRHGEGGREWRLTLLGVTKAQTTG